MKKLTLLLFALILCLPVFVRAQTTSVGQNDAIPEQITSVRARALDVSAPPEDGAGASVAVRARIEEGDDVGKICVLKTVSGDVRPGEEFFIRRTFDPGSGAVFYSFDEPYRLPQVLLLIFVFIVVTLSFGGKQGLRGLLSLCGSLLLIGYVLVPWILGGTSPIVATLVVAALIVTLGSYVTHGFNRTTTSAVLGMIGAVLVTGAFAYYAVHALRLSGFGNEEEVYLNHNAGGAIDMPGLLFSGILIGLLGVLYDVAIGQAVAIEELLRAAPAMHVRTLFARGLRIGREHIGALVNMLAIAYVGASLPMLLLLAQTPGTNFAVAANREVFAAEIARTMIGSIGLVLAVPITTFVSVWMLSRRRDRIGTNAGGHGVHAHAHGHMQEKTEA